MWHRLAPVHYDSLKIGVVCKSLTLRHQFVDLNVFHSVFVNQYIVLKGPDFDRSAVSVNRHGFCDSRCFTGFGVAGVAFDFHGSGSVVDERGDCITER